MNPTPRAGATSFMGPVRKESSSTASGKEMGILTSALAALRARGLTGELKGSEDDCDLSLEFTKGGETQVTASMVEH